MADTGKLEGIAFKTARRGPMHTTDACFVGLETGVHNDVRGLPGKRQVTVLSREAFDLACAELGMELPWTIRRANLLVSGLHLAESTGKRIQIGEVWLEITGETDPCHRMDEQQPGLKDALMPDWRGGVLCRVLSEGFIKISDTVILHEKSMP